MATLRRRFVGLVIKGGIVGWLASLFYPIVSFLDPPKVTGPAVHSVKAASVDDIAPNSGRIIKFGRQPVILIRTPSGELRAFSAVCTHLGCIVQYRDDLDHIWCACRNGHYDLQGRNISGPPPKPLQRYDVGVVDEEIIVSRPQQA